MAVDSLQFDPLFREMEARLKKGGLILAIDGRCASGKTTLAELIGKKYDCNVFHMDDFFLQPSMRTPERLRVPGENVDHERFLTEVLLPVYYKEPVRYRRYNCHEGRMEAAVEVPVKALNVIEGSYSLHPDLFSYYGVKVFLDVSEEEQRTRILRRNGEAFARRFFNEWIPMEESYFSAYHIREKADMIISRMP